MYFPLKSVFFTTSKVYTKYIDHSDLKLLLKNGFFRKYWVYTADILKKYSVYTEYSCGAVRHGSRKNSKNMNIGDAIQKLIHHPPKFALNVFIYASKLKKTWRAGCVQILFLFKMMCEMVTGVHIRNRSPTGFLLVEIRRVFWKNRRIPTKKNPI